MAMLTSDSLKHRCAVGRWGRSTIQPRQTLCQPCAASSSAAQGAVLVPLPASQEDAVKEAAKALAYELRDIQATKSSKGFAKKSSGRVMTSVEIPTAASASSDLAALAGQLVTMLTAAMKTAQAVTIVFADARAADIASPASTRPGEKAAVPLPAGTRVMELRAACREETLSGGVLLVVAPALAEVALVEQLVVDTWTGPATVLLNAGFLNPGAGVPAAQQEFVSSFETAYCFQPVEVKGLLGAMSGAAIKVSGPGGAGAVWRICMTKAGISSDGNMLQIGQMKNRPSTSDLELAFINANASASPLTKLVKTFKRDKK